MHSLQLDTFPLTPGRRLIEASAGTGKTFTIASLYVRLLLGLEQQTPNLKCALTVEQILVVTFTDAATSELRMRILQRIQQTRQALLSADAVDEPFMAYLCERITDRSWALRCLEAAQRQMDNAAIFTIHGLCARILKDYTLAAGQRLDTQLQEDVQPLLHQAAGDFWRCCIQSLPADMVQLIRHWANSPNDLLQRLAPCFVYPDVHIKPAPSLRPLAQQQEDLLTTLHHLQRLWYEQADVLTDILIKADFKKNILRPATLTQHITAMQGFGQGEPLAIDSLRYLSATKFATAMKKGASPPDHAVFALADSLSERIETFYYRLLHDALHYIQHNFALSKQQAAQRSFDDLLRDCDAAVVTHPALAHALRVRYPVAMVDEFQDTDPVQYHLLDHLYPIGTGLLVMIGDPKQAIYAFRGADMATYLKARDSTEEHYVLDTNWRSSASLVHGVNVLSGYNPAALAIGGAPFVPVKAAKQGDEATFTLAGKAQAAVQFWLHEDESGTREAYLEAQSLATAKHIHYLLGEGAHKRACVGNKAITAGDCAVLVRTGKEADRIQTALSNEGVDSVYLSHRDSVFASTEAADIRWLLEAIAHPNKQRISAALATDLFAWPLEKLAQLSTDIALLEQMTAHMRAWQAQWLSQGILPMLRAVVFEQSIAARLLATDERKLTNVLHLAEQLQTASQKHRGMPALLRWFSRAIEQPPQEDQGKLRLQTDRNLVKIVTIHKSKGLEYPLVWLPFAVFSQHPARVTLYHEHHQQVLNFNPTPEEKDQARTETLQEGLRLLYVALTRAVSACFVGLYTGGRGTKALANSALGYLLHVESASCVQQVLHDFTQHHPNSLLSRAPPDVLVAPLRPQAPLPPLQVRTFDGHIESHWRIQSYSSLTKAAPSGWMQRGLEVEDVSRSRHHQAQTGNVVAFPKGPRYGTLLHSVLEQVDFQQPDYALLSPIIRAMGWDEAWQTQWQPAMEQLVERTLQTPFLPNGGGLSALKAAHCVREMEFLLSMPHLSAQQINAIIQPHTPLQAGKMQGFLTGFMDLVFLWQGQYYLLDYKSNDLGNRLEHYDQEAIKAAMQEHQYDVQGVLYTLALHRLLSQRRHHYDYHRHMGGVYYVFLRGLNGHNDDTGIAFHKPDYSTIAQLDALFADNEGLLTPASHSKS